MNIASIKAIKDLKSNLGRSFLVVFALVVGIWGLGTIIVSSSILNKDLNENYIRTKPPHVILTSENFDKLNFDEFKNLPEIESAEYRDFSLKRIEVKPDEWIPLWLSGVDDFSSLNLAVFYNQKGKQASENGEMLIERNGMLISNLDAGVTAQIRTGDHIINIPVSGICFDPAQAPSNQDHLIYGYVNKKTFKEITGEDTNHRLIYRLRNINSSYDVQTENNKVLEYLKSKNISLTKVEIPKLNEHPHQWQLNTLMFLIGSIGFLSFLMGAVMVSQLMSSILAKQVRQIGILKAIGASKFKIFKIYLIMLLLFGITSGVIAVPLALKSGYAFSKFVAGIINFEIFTTTLPASIYLSLISISLILPVVFSLPAILKGINLSVRDALSDYGISQNAEGKNILIKGKLPISNRFILAFRNTFRKRKGLYINILALSLGVAIFSTGFNVRESLWYLLSNYKDSMKYDVLVSLNDQVSKEEIERPFQSLKNMKKTETWTGGRGALQSKVVSTSEGIGIVALPYDSDLLKFKVTKGRWLIGIKEPEIVMNQQAYELYNKPVVGEQHMLNIGGKQMYIRLAGVVEEFEKSKIYIDRYLFDSLFNPSHKVNTLLFVAENNDYNKVMELKRNIENSIASTNLNVLNVLSRAERVKVIYDHLEIVLTTIVIVAFLVLLVSALGMASTTGINIMERTREIGVMRAIGAAPGIIYHIFVLEGMIISIASIIIGMFLAWPLSLLAAIFFGKLMLGDEAVLSYAFSFSGFWITLLVTIIFSWISSMIPSRSAIKVSASEALYYE